jgi:hypothetical protein
MAQRQNSHQIRRAFTNRRIQAGRQGGIRAKTAQGASPYAWSNSGAVEARFSASNAHDLVQ